MTPVEALYEGGVLRLLQPRLLSENAHSSFVIEFAPSRLAEDESNGVHAEAGGGERFG